MIKQVCIFIVTLFLFILCCKKADTHQPKSETEELESLWSKDCESIKKITKKDYCISLDDPKHFCNLIEPSIEKNDFSFLKNNRVYTDEDHNPIIFILQGSNELIVRHYFRDKYVGKSDDFFFHNSPITHKGKIKYENNKIFARLENLNPYHEKDPKPIIIDTSFIRCFTGYDTFHIDGTIIMDEKFTGYEIGYIFKEPYMSGEKIIRLGKNK